MASSKMKAGDGYTYEFVATPPKALSCHLCYLVARDPQLSVCCGTNFCRGCLERKTSERGSRGCPACNHTGIVTAFPNKLSDREIKKLIVRCLNNEEGCDWKDELAKLEGHVANCGMQGVECSLKCGTTLKRAMLDGHLKNECPCRQTSCEYCNMTGEYHVIVGEHGDQCSKLPLNCPNDCGLTDIIRSEMEEHLKKCPLQKTICKYHNIGCKAMLTSEDQDEHDEACMKEHFQLMSKELVVAKEELANANLRLNRANQFTEQIRNELMDVTLQASNAEQSLEKLTDELSLTKEELVITKVNISKAEQNTENMQKEFEARMLKIQEEFYQWKEVSCSAFCGILPSLDWQAKLVASSVLLEQSNVVVPVIIRITGVSEKTKNNETFQSPTFYTHDSGYRVCLLVTLNGVDECKGYCISVTISILSGPYDAKLSWPFMGQFTVSLLNQVKNSTHRFQRLTVNSKEIDTHSASSDLSAEYICKRFISHTELFSASTFHKYYTADTIYLQVRYLGDE